MYDMKSMKAEEFISDEEIRATLKYADDNKDNMVVRMRKNCRKSTTWQDR